MKIDKDIQEMCHEAICNPEDEAHYGIEAHKMQAMRNFANTMERLTGVIVNLATIIRNK